VRGPSGSYASAIFLADLVSQSVRRLTQIHCLVIKATPPTARASLGVDA
jgi:hypothetical protein